MQVIDPHLHFWSLAENNQPWLRHPKPNLLGDYSPMAHDFGPAELARQTGDIELIGGVHIEADAQDPIAETRWLDQQLTHADWPMVMVVGADLSRPDALEQLTQQQHLSTRVRGVRQILNVHEEPHFDYVGRHFMNEAQWQTNLALLGPLGLSFDLQIYPQQMSQAAALAAQHPDITFILNHTGMYVDRQGIQGWREWRNGLRHLASQDNVALKISGFGMLDHHWTLGSIRPLLLEAVDCFGTDRCMLASNFPVDGLYARYATIWQAYADILGTGSPDEFGALFRDNARRIYRLPEADQ